MMIFRIYDSTAFQKKDYLSLLHQKHHQKTPFAKKKPENKMILPNIINLSFFKFFLKLRFYMGENDSEDQMSDGTDALSLSPHDSGK